MSLRGKDFRCEIDPDLYEYLRIIAEHQDLTIQVLGAQLLEKAIVGEFHAFSLMVKKLERSGILRNGRGTPRKIAEGDE
jgi:hypothetical protein